MSLRELSKYIFSSKYARYLPEKKRRESWNEAVARVEKMHLNKYPNIIEEIKWAFEFVYNKRVSGSQRALQFGGKAVLDKAARQYNCCSSYCDRLRFFQEAFYCLLCGTGVGYSVQKHHVAKLPNFDLSSKSKSKKTYIIPDSIEGWSDSIGVLLSSYFENPEFPEYKNCSVTFDISQIRPKGAFLSSSSGKAPGPEPLVECLDQIKKLLDKCIANGQKRLDPINAHDIIMFIADATLSGGVRRSSCIALFSLDDQAMMECKTGNWGYENPQRARANNSVVLLRNQTSYEQFLSILEHTKSWGDPGIYWTDNLETLTNPSLLSDTLVKVKIDTHILYEPIQNLVDKSFQVFNANNEWVNAKCVCSNIDYHNLYKVTFSDGSVFYTSKEHRWPLQNINLGKKATYELCVGDQVHSNSSFNIISVQSVETTDMSGPVYDIQVFDETNCFYITDFNVHSTPIEILTGNCCEISLYGYYEDKSGFQFCNLSSINGKKIKCKEDLMEAAKAAAIIGTLQAGYTNFEYLGETTKKITERESLLGVSITGVQDNPEIILNTKYQKAAVDIIRQTNKEIAAKIGINAAARLTTLKPEGTNSLVMESSSGIHPHHARRYFRNVQANGIESLANFFRKKNPLAVQKSYHKEGDYVLTFCINVEKGSITKNDLSAIELLKQVKSTQMNWVTYGKNPELCAQPWLNHNVSNTINVKDDEWDSVAKYIYNNRDYFCGISLFPHDCDRDYRQAPNVAVLNTSEITKEYGDGSLFASGLIVEGLDLFDGDLWGATDAVLGINPIKLTVEMDTWVNKVKKFAARYLEGNIKKTTYLMKDVYNAKRWQDLTREYKEVDYTECLEDEDNTKPEQEIACAGGSCTLI